MAAAEVAACPRDRNPSKTGVEDAGSAMLPSMSTTERVASAGWIVLTKAAGSRAVKSAFQPPSRVTFAVDQHVLRVGPAGDADDVARRRGREPRGERGVAASPPPGLTHSVPVPASAGAAARSSAGTAATRTLVGEPRGAPSRSGRCGMGPSFARPR